MSRQGSAGNVIVALVTMDVAQHVRSLAPRERVGVRERSGASRHLIVRGSSARPMIVSSFIPGLGPRVPGRLLGAMFPI